MKKVLVKWAISLAVRMVNQWLAERKDKCGEVCEKAQWWISTLNSLMGLAAEVCQCSRDGVLTDEEVNGVTRRGQELLAQMV